MKTLSSLLTSTFRAQTTTNQWTARTLRPIRWGFVDFFLAYLEEFWSKQLGDLGMSWCSCEVIVMDCTATWWKLHESNHTSWMIHVLITCWNTVKIVHNVLWALSHDDVIKWKDFPRYWPFVRGIHRSPVNSPHKGQWRGALMFSLISARINGWVNNREAGDLRHICRHYDVTVMPVVLLF